MCTWTRTNHEIRRGEEGSEADWILFFVAKLLMFIALLCDYYIITFIVYCVVSLIAESLSKIYLENETSTLFGKNHRYTLHICKIALVVVKLHKSYKFVNLSLHLWIISYAFGTLLRHISLHRKSSAREEGIFEAEHN